MIKNWELKIKENKSTLIINDWGVKSDDIIDLARHLVIKFHFYISIMKILAKSYIVR